MSLSRRRFVEFAALASAGLLAAPAAGVSPRASARRRVARLAHLTDLHIQPELNAERGVAQCLHAVQSIGDRPEFIVTGGDLVMDVFEQKQPRAEALWKILRSTFKNECALPVRHCLGNHDIWGWHRRNSGLRGDEPRFGKAWALEELQMPRAHYAFDVGEEKGGWRVIVLDSVLPDPRDPNGYIGGLDEAQWAWLEEEFTTLAGRRSVAIVTHIPIVTVTTLVDPKVPAALERSLSAGLLMTDSSRLQALFRKHGNVRLCLSGHIHDRDRVEYQGVTYICDGAVSGSWWKGANRGVSEGFGVVDLYDDGSFDHRYETYGWTAVS